MLAPTARAVEAETHRTRWQSLSSYLARNRFENSMSPSASSECHSPLSSTISRSRISFTSARSSALYISTWLIVGDAPDLDHIRQWQLACPPRSPKESRDHQETPKVMLRVTTENSRSATSLNLLWRTNTFARKVQNAAVGTMASSATRTATNGRSYTLTYDTTRLPLTPGEFLRTAVHREQKLNAYSRPIVFAGTSPERQDRGC